MGGSKSLDFKRKSVMNKTCLFSRFSGSLEQTSTFTSTYIYFPCKVAVAVLGGGGGLLFYGALIVYNFRLLWASLSLQTKLYLATLPHMAKIC